MRPPKFKPRWIEGRRRWLVEVPASVSEDGERSRKYFRIKADATSFAAELGTRHGPRGRDLHAEMGSIGATLADAVDYYMSAHVAHSPLFPEAFAQFRASKSHRRERTLSEYDWFERVLEPATHLEVQEITSPDLESLVTGSGYRRAKIRRIAKTFFNYCWRKGWVVENIADRLDPVALPFRDEIGILSPKDIGNLLSSCRPELVPYFAFAAFAGIRPGELLRLDWSDVGADKITVGRKTSKVDKTRHIPITETLSAWIEGYRTSGPIMPLDGHFYGSGGHLIRARESAGLVERWPADCLRHSFASYHLAEFGDINGLCLALGHMGGTQMLFDHYFRAVDADTARRFWNLRPGAAGGKVVTFSGA